MFQWSVFENDEIVADDLDSRPSQLAWDMRHRFERAELILMLGISQALFGCVCMNPLYVYNLHRGFARCTMASQ